MTCNDFHLYEHRGEKIYVWWVDDMGFWFGCIPGVLHHDMQSPLLDFDPITEETTDEPTEEMFVNTLKSWIDEFYETAEGPVNFSASFPDSIRPTDIPF